MSIKMSVDKNWKGIFLVTDFFPFKSFLVSDVLL